VTTQPAADGQATTTGRAPLGRRIGRALVSADSYGLVLLLIIVTYLMSITVKQPVGASVVLAVQIATVWLVLRTARAHRWARITATVLLVLAAATAIVQVFLPEEEGLSSVFVASTVLYAFAPFSIVRDLGERGEVDGEVVLGAIAAYLLIGMFFAFAYRTVASVQAGPFFGPDGDGAMSDHLFFSFVTLSTTGYGNLVPAANPGQTMAVGEAIFGQLFLVVAVAKVISAWQPRRMREESEPTPPSER
jgi:hypothetical protein